MSEPEVASPAAPRRALWLLTYPIIVGNLSAVALTVADGVVLGRFSTEAVAAVGLAAPVATVATMLATGWATAVQVLAARHHGAGEPDMVNRVLDVGAAIGLAIGALLGVVLVAVASPLMRVLVSDGELASSAARYLQIVALGLPLSGAMTALRSGMGALGLTKVTMRAAVGVNVVNLPVDIALVYGLGLGVTGAALGTVLALASGFGALVWYTWRRLPGGRGRRPDIAGWREELPRMWRIGWPDTAMLTAGYFSTVVLAAVVAGLGITALAAWSILGRALAVLWTVIYACSTGVAIMVGQRLGAADGTGVDDAVRAGWAVTGGLAAVIVAPIVLAPGLVFGIFSTDAAVVDAAVGTGLFLFGQTPLMVATMVYTGTLRAGGDTKSILIAGTVANYLCSLPASWVLAVPLGLELRGVFLGQFGYWALRLALIYRSYAAGAWRTATI